MPPANEVSANSDGGKALVTRNGPPGCNCVASSVTAGLHLQTGNASPPACATNLLAQLPLPRGPASE